MLFAVRGSPHTAAAGMGMSLQSQPLECQLRRWFELAPGQAGAWHPLPPLLHRSGHGAEGFMEQLSLAVGERMLLLQASTSLGWANPQGAFGSATVLLQHGRATGTV